MKRLLSHTTAALMAISLLASPAMAQPGHDRGPPPPPTHQMRPPPPPDAHWDRDRGPPPSWGERNWQYRQSYLRRHHHDENDHDSTTGLVAGVILGFVLGAAVADSNERQEYARTHHGDHDWNDTCARRYRSFDRDTGTYLGTDGLRHYCR